MKGANLLVTIFLWFILMALVFGTPAKLALFPLLVLIFGIAIDTPHGFSVERFVEKERVVIGEKIKVTVRVKVRGGMGVVVVRENVPSSLALVSGKNFLAFFTYPGRRAIEFSYVVLPLKRGEFEIPRTEIFSFHFLRIHPMRWGVYGDPVKITVYPKLHAMGKVRQLRAFRRGYRATSPSLVGVRSVEFKEIRDYVPGDPFKTINWKATARTGRLLVNEYEREGRSSTMIFIDARMESVGSQTKNPLEYAIALAYSLSNYLLEKGENVGLYVVGQGKIVTPSSSLAHRETILKALVGATCLYEESLEEAFNKARRILRTYKPRILVITNVTPRIVDEVREVKRAWNVMLIDVSIYCELSEDACSLIKLRKLSLYRELGVKIIPWDTNKESVERVMIKVLGAM
ncbi:hypothetical protein PNA2_0946 [Pyrococcus sp. NA2]|uniref:DUF58 domain-containing protein n=1 Tax=Pyrococcus sp. (strain NA2) TaxID=342949 RepID=UPI000209A919|nr:DUF58 domain-containing protein [Pyrococcus sp. NA2]AEC51862.1 hypothetical protein PNA2_0946 [Pyrococcus sp. NA2]